MNDVLKKNRQSAKRYAKIAYFRSKDTFLSRITLKNDYFDFAENLCSFLCAK